MRIMVGALALSLSGCINLGASLVQIESGEEFRIDRFEPGVCRFNFRSQMTRIEAVGGEVAWQVEVPWHWSSQSGLALSEDTMAFSTEHGVAALDLIDGSPLWQLTGDDNFYTINQTKDTVLIKSGSLSSSVLHARDPHTGELLWSRELDTESNPLFALVANQVVLNKGGSLFATSVDSGAETWTLPTDGDGSYGPVAIDSYLFHSAYQGGLYRIDPISGEVLWRWQPPAQTAVTSLAAINGATVVFETTGAWLGSDREPPSEADQIVAVDLDTGQKVWSTSRRTTTAGGDDYAAEVTFGNSLLAIRGPRTASVVDMSNGQVQWDLSGPFFGSFSLDDSHEYVFIAVGSYEDAAKVAAYDRETGAEIWNSPFSPGDLTVRLETDLGLLVGQSFDNDSVDQNPGGALYLVDPDSGQVMWQRLLRDGVDLGNVLRYKDSFLVRSADPTIGCD